MIKGTTEEDLGTKKILEDGNGSRGPKGEQVR